MPRGAGGPTPPVAQRVDAPEESLESVRLSCNDRPSVHAPCARVRARPCPWPVHSCDNLLRQRPECKIEWQGIAENIARRYGPHEFDWCLSGC